MSREERQVRERGVLMYEMQYLIVCLSEKLIHGFKDFLK